MEGYKKTIRKKIQVARVGSWKKDLGNCKKLCDITNRCKAFTLKFSKNCEMYEFYGNEEDDFDTMLFEKE